MELKRRLICKCGSTMRIRKLPVTTLEYECENKGCSRQGVISRIDLTDVGYVGKDGKEIARKMYEDQEKARA